MSMLSVRSAQWCKQWSRLNWMSQVHLEILHFCLVNRELLCAPTYYMFLEEKRAYMLSELIPVHANICLYAVYAQQIQGVEADSIK